MHGALPLFSRLALIGAIALPTWAITVCMSRCPLEDVAELPPCHGHGELATDVEVVDAAFGIDTWLEGEGYVFTETDHLHLVPGTSFGWRLQLKNPAETVLLREEFVLPDAPAYWGLGPDTRLSDDRRVAITERFVPAVDGFLSSQWTVTPGDPSGVYEMRVFLDGQLVRTFAVEAHEDH